MIRMIIAYLGMASLVFAGAQSEVTLKEEKEVIAASDTVFEAIFVEEKVSYIYDGKVVTKKEAIKRESVRVGGGLSKPFIRREITLLVTQPIKGVLNKYQVVTVGIEDRLFSECPHFLNYGDYTTKQIYYTSGESKDHNYRYRKVREPVKFSSLMNRKTILGDLGERIGREIKIEGRQPKKVNSSPFVDDSDYFQVSKVGGTEAYAKLNLKLDSEYAAAGGKLPDREKEVILEGYESIDVIPFSDSVDDDLDGIGINELEAKFPKLYNAYVFKTVFIVTDVLYK